MSATGDLSMCMTSRNVCVTSRLVLMERVTYFVYQELTRAKNEAEHLLSRAISGLAQ